MTKKSEEQLGVHTAWAHGEVISHFIGVPATSGIRFPVKYYPALSDYIILRRRADDGFVLGYLVIDPKSSDEPLTALVEEFGQIIPSNLQIPFEHCLYRANNIPYSQVVALYVVSEHPRARWGVLARDYNAGVAEGFWCPSHALERQVLLCAAYDVYGLVIADRADGSNLRFLWTDNTNTKTIADSNVHWVINGARKLLHLREKKKAFTASIKRQAVELAKRAVDLHNLWQAEGVLRAVVEIYDQDRKPIGPATVSCEFIGRHGALTEMRAMVRRALRLPVEVGDACRRKLPGGLLKQFRGSL